MVDLSQSDQDGSSPIIKAISAMSQLIDPENYVMTGFETRIQPNNTSGFYFCNKGLYRSFSELDLEEMKRLTNNMNEERKKIRQLDSQALNASFAGYSMFTLLTGSVHLYRQIYQEL